MKKKILAIGLVVCMLVVAIGSATMAYFTDTEGAVNVMTVGSIKIEQHEEDRDGKDFEQNQPLWPIPDVNGPTDTDGDGYWDDANVIDKVVTVENTGKSDAYYRTWIAFEGDKDFMDCCLVANHIEDLTYFGEAEIDGATYSVYLYAPKYALEAGETSDAILKQFALHARATQENVKAFGDTYEVLVLTQAVQMDGFSNAESALTAAFGTDHPWGADTSWYTNIESGATVYKISDAADLRGLAQLIKDGEEFDLPIEIVDDIDLGGTLWTPINLWNPENPATIKIEGNGYTISNMTVTGKEQVGFIGTSTANIIMKNLTFENANVVATSRFVGTVIGYQYGNVVLENVDVKNSVIEAPVANVAIRAGGLVGFCACDDGATLSLIDCDSIGNTISAYHNAGGLIGTAQAPAKGGAASMTNCTSIDNTFYYGGKFNATEQAARAFDCNGYNVGASEKTGCTDSGNTYIKCQKVTDTASLEQAIADGAKIITAKAGEYTVPGGAGVTIIGSGLDTEITISGNIQDMVVKNATVTNNNSLSVQADTTAVFENVVFKGNLGMTAQGVANGDMTFTDCTFEAGFHIDNSTATTNVTFNDCTFGEYGFIKLGGSANYAMNGCVIETLASDATGPWGKEWAISYSDITFTDCVMGRVVRAGGAITITLDGCVDVNGDAVTDAIVHTYNSPTVVIK